MERLSLNNTHIWFDETLLKEKPALCFDIAFWQQKDAVLGSATGRGTTWFVQTETVPAALRHYRRGGLFGKLVKDSYLFTGWERTRAAEEFNLLHYLREAGIAVPRPLAARAVREGLTYQADILVEKIEGARDLVAILTEETLTPTQYRTVGRLVRQLHDAGVCHTDLNIHNILLDNEGCFWLIDFDKCGRRDGDSWKAANLSRLQRSFNKEVERFQIRWQPADWNALMQGYQGE